MSTQTTITICTSLSSKHSQKLSITNSEFIAFSSVETEESKFIIYIRLVL